MKSEAIHNGPRVHNTKSTVTVYPATIRVDEKIPTVTATSARLYARVIAVDENGVEMTAGHTRLSDTVMNLLRDGEITVYAKPIFGTMEDPGRVLRQLFTICKIGLFRPEVAFRVDLATQVHQPRSK